MGACRTLSGSINSVLKIYACQASRKMLGVNSMMSYSEIRNGMGVVIKTRRLQNGMSQSDLGKEVGVSFQAIGELERGINTLSVPRLVKISHALKTTPAEMITEGISPEKTEASTQEFRIIKLIKQMTAKQKNILYNCLKVIVSKEELA